MGYLIGGLRQRLTKNRDRLTSSQKKTLEKTITYFENHRDMMHYDVYLNKGYPIATGVVEGTCAWNNRACAGPSTERRRS